jgi:hypothetical protein
MLRLALVAVLLVRRGRSSASAQWVEGTHYERPDGHTRAAGRRAHRGGRGLLVRLPFLLQLRAAPAALATDVNLTMSPSYAIRGQHERPHGASTRVHSMRPRPWGPRPDAPADLPRTIHIDRTRTQHASKACAELFQQHADIDPETFRTTYQSFRRRDPHAPVVTTSIRRLPHVSAVPTIIVNGRYRTNPGPHPRLPTAH